MVVSVAYGQAAAHGREVRGENVRWKPEKLELLAGENPLGSEGKDRGYEKHCQQVFIGPLAAATVFSGFD